MSHSAVISRGYRWAEDGSFVPISISEWKSVILSRKLSAVEYLECVNPMTGEVIRIKTPDSARIRDQGPLLSWKKGVIQLNCDQSQYDHCRPIASDLGASIFGDDGEKY